MVDATQFKQIFGRLLKEWNNPQKNLEQVDKLLEELQASLFADPAMFMPTESGPSLESLMMERKMLEIITLTACLKRDVARFPVAIAQLMHYYEDFKLPDKMPDSEIRNEIIGLNLMYLLTQNKLGELNTQLERIPVKIRNENAFISMPIKLKQFLMQGMYNEIFQSKANMPSPYYLHFMDILLSTVRDEIASCMEKAHQTLSVKEVARLLFVDGKNAQHDILEYGKKKGWKLSGSTFNFASENEKNEENVIRTVPMAEKLIFYAKHLETIV